MKPLDDRFADALRKAYARPDLRLHGLAAGTVQDLVARGLAQAVVSRGRYERHVLSPEGERQAASLMRDALAQRGQPSPSPVSSPQSDPSVIPTDTWCSRLVDFLASADPNATTVTVDLPPTRRTPAGWRARIERCGPTKLLIQMIPPKIKNAEP